MYPTHVRIFPQRNPHNYTLLSEATYYDEPKMCQQFVNDNLQNTKILETYEFAGWKFMLFEQDGKLIVGCRGTHDSTKATLLSNWSDNIARVAVSLTDILPISIPHVPVVSLLPGSQISQSGMIWWVNKTIAEWETKYGNSIYAITGHSAGGWWASRLIHDEYHKDVFRITQNAIDPEDYGDYRGLHMRLTDDLVSRVCFKKFQFILNVGPGEHAIRHYACIKDKSFSDVGFTEYVLENPSKDLNEKSNDSTSKLVPKPCLPENYSPLITPAESEKQAMLADLEKFRASLPEGHTLLLVESKNIPENIQFEEEYKTKHASKSEIFMEGVRLIALEVLAEQQRRVHEDEIKTKTKEGEKQTDLQRQRIETNDRNHARELSLEQIKHQIYTHANPAHVGKEYSEVLKFREQLNNEIKFLNDSVKDIPDLCGILELKLEHLDKLNDLQKKHYNQALEYQSQLRQRLGMVCSVLTVAISLVAFTQCGPAAAGVASAVSHVALGVFQRKLEKKTYKIQSQYSNAQQQSLYTQETLAHERQRLNSQLAAIENSRDEIRNVLIEYEIFFESQDHIKKLKTELKKISTEIDVNATNQTKKQSEIDKNNIKINNFHQEIEKQTEDAKLFHQALVGLNDKLKGKFKDSEGKKITAEEALELAIQDATRETQEALLKEEVELFRNSEDLKDLVAEETRKKASQKKLEGSKEDAERFSPLRESRDKDVETLTKFEKERKEFVKSYSTRLESLRSSYQPYASIANSVNTILQSFQNPIAAKVGDLFTYGNKSIDKVFELITFIEKFSASKAIDQKTFLETFKALGFKLVVGTAMVPFLEVIGTSIIILYTAKFISDCVRNKLPPSEFQQTINEIGKLGYDIKNFINYKFENAEQLIQVRELMAQNRQTNLLKSFEYLRFCLQNIKEDLSLTFQLGIQKAVNTTNNQSFCSHLQDIKNYRNKLLRMINKSSTDPRHFLENLSSAMVQACSNEMNGFHLGDRGNVITAIHHSFYMQKPHSLSGLIGAITQNTLSIPNWIILEDINSHFIQMFSFFSNKIEDNVYLKERFIEKCKDILKLNRDLLSVLDFKCVIENINKLNSLQFNRLINNSINIISKKKEQFEFEVNNAKLHFKNRVAKVLLNTILGSKRYYLYEICNQSDFLTPEIFQLDWAPFYQIGTTNRFSYNPGICQTVSNAFDKILKHTSNKVTIFFNNNQLAISYIETPSTIINGSLKELSLSSLGCYSPIENTIYLDLSTKKIVIQPPTSVGNRVEKLATLCIVPYIEFNNLFGETYGYTLLPKFDYDSKFRKDELANIPQPEIDLITYNKKSIQLCEEYVDFVNHLCDDIPLKTSNIFNPLVSNCQIILPKKQELPILVFPKSFIEQIQKSVSLPLQYLEATNKGFVSVYYDFCSDERRLDIILDYNPIDPTLNSQEYCRFAVAHLDQLTFDSYQSDFRSVSNRHNVNEILVNAFYGYLVDIGMPGKDSLRLSNGLVAPKDVDFKGFYKIWEKNCAESNSLFHIFYDSYKFEIGKEADLCFSLTPVFGKSYPEIFKMAIEAKQNFKAIEEYTKMYNLLKAQIHLVSDIPDSTLDEQLIVELGVYSPENIHLLINKRISGEKKFNLTHDNIKRFLELLHALPNQRILKLKTNYSKIKEILNFLEFYKTSKTKCVVIPNFEAICNDVNLSVPYVANAETHSIASNNPTTMRASSLEKPSSLSAYTLSALQDIIKTYRSKILDNSLSLQAKIDYHNDFLKNLNKNSVEAMPHEIESAFIQLVEKIFTNEDVDHDGNCLFSSLGYFVNETHKEIRNNICNTLEKYRDLTEFLNEDIKQYISKMRKLGEWGDETEINAFMRFYMAAINRQVHVYDVNHILKVENGNLIPGYTVYGLPSIHDPITLIRTRGAHYSILKKK